MTDKPRSYERLHLPGVHSEDLVTRHHVPVVHEISSGLAAKASNLSNTTVCPPDTSRDRGFLRL